METENYKGNGGIKMAKDKNVDKRRSFLTPDGETRYYVVIPSAEDIKGADWAYSKTYTKCLVEGITTSAEMLDILRRRGIIGPEFEQRAAELTTELNEKVFQLEQSDSVEEKRILSVEVANAREELFQWNQRLSGPMNNTCEQISDDARLEYLTSCMIRDEEGSKVWGSYESYLKESDQALISTSRFEVMLFLQGVDSDFLEKTPEAKAMREVEEDIIKKAEEAVKAAKAIAEEEAKEKTEEKKVGKAESKATKKTRKRASKKSKK